ncbi:hypothetical protein KAW44_06555 [Candidatus Bipolaricaulota bacterium]|nr:hypothetical protein [Candidatus Bipolaricaulota bacterium]
MLGRGEEARSVAQRAVDLLNAKPVDGGQYTTILDPYLAGVFSTRRSVTSARLIFCSRTSD